MTGSIKPEVNDRLSALQTSQPVRLEENTIRQEIPHSTYKPTLTGPVSVYCIVVYFTKHRRTLPSTLVQYSSLKLHNDPQP